jgi:hypothetical protein
MMDRGQPLPFDRAAASAYLNKKRLVLISKSYRDRQRQQSNDLLVVEDGQPAAFERSAASGYLKDDTVLISVSIGNDPGFGTAWGCDLSYDYVKINAEYTTERGDSSLSPDLFPSLNHLQTPTCIESAIAQLKTASSNNPAKSVFNSCHAVSVSNNTKNRDNPGQIPN